MKVHADVGTIQPWIFVTKLRREQSALMSLLAHRRKTVSRRNPRWRSCFLQAEAGGKTTARNRVYGKGTAGGRTERKGRALRSYTERAQRFRLLTVDVSSNFIAPGTTFPHYRFRDSSR
ncbi:hypothetical protein AMECASPLE_023254 [Ameca splendens]|uniref:Uncharacterized protein n=1 Tax=Ameca splendens TaxID=208324 RepID=A0ABV0YF51_9TELE